MAVLTAEVGHVRDVGDVAYGVRTSGLRPYERAAPTPTHHVVHVLPVVQRDELESRQHGPHEVIEVGVAMVRILAHLQTEEPRRAVPAT